MRKGSSRCNLRDAELDVVINGDAVQARESRKPAWADFRRERASRPSPAEYLIQASQASRLVRRSPMDRVADEFVRRVTERVPRLTPHIIEITGSRTIAVATAAVSANEPSTMTPHFTAIPASHRTTKNAIVKITG
jgi:hypothetical protein